MRIRQLLLLLCFFIFHPSAADNSLKHEDPLADLERVIQACQASLSDPNCDIKRLPPFLVESITALQESQRKLEQAGLGRGSGKLARNVTYFTDSITDESEDLITLSGGSSWLLNRDYFGLAFEDVLVILRDDNTAIIFVNGDSYRAKRVKGVAFSKPGTLATIVSSLGNGAMLETDDGIRLFFGSYEQYDTGWWLPPYEVLIDSAGLNMWHLDSMKKVWIESIE